MLKWAEHVELGSIFSDDGVGVKEGMGEKCILHSSLGFNFGLRTRLFDGKSVENEGKLILTETSHRCKNMIFESIENNSF